MEMIIQKQGVYFYGHVKDIKNLFAQYPPELTLLEFINLHLN